MNEEEKDAPQTVEAILNSVVATAADFEPEIEISEEV